MQTASEIQSALKNLRYYIKSIANQAKTQFQLDYDRGTELGINTSPGSIRYDCLGVIVEVCALIDCYCDNIKANLETAIKQDKVLHTEEKEE